MRPSRQFKLSLHRDVHRDTFRVALRAHAPHSSFCATLLWDRLAPLVALSWACRWSFDLGSHFTAFCLACLPSLIEEVITKCEYDSAGWNLGGIFLVNRGWLHYRRCAGGRRLVDNLFQLHTSVWGWFEVKIQAARSLLCRGRSLSHMVYYLKQSLWRQIFGALAHGNLPPSDFSAYEQRSKVSLSQKCRFVLTYLPAGEIWFALWSCTWPSVWF